MWAGICMTREKRNAMIINEYKESRTEITKRRIENELCKRNTEIVDIERLEFNNLGESLTEFIGNGRTQVKGTTKEAIAHNENVLQANTVETCDEQIQGEM